jgi:hypothetical protein
MDSTLVDCRHFHGDIPCKPHKSEGVHCAAQSVHIETFA